MLEQGEQIKRKRWNSKKTLSKKGKPMFYGAFLRDNLEVSRDA